MPRLTRDALHDLLCAIYEGAGVGHEEASLVAAHQVGASLAGHDSHGPLRTGTYLERMSRGEIVPGAAFEIVEETASTAVVDGNWGFGFVQTARATELAIDKARTSGVAAVTIRHQGHMGRLGSYMETVAGAGMIGLLGSSSGRAPKVVAPFGGRHRRLGTNPISFGIPTGGDGPPLVLDMATSAVAQGKIHVARNSGQQLAEGLIVDKEGRSTTDPADYYEGGALLPMGGAQAHKGFGLSVVIEILCGLLTGLGFGAHPEGPHSNGNFLAVFDVARFRDPEEFTADVDDFISYLKDTPPADGFDEVLYPGELEARTRADREANGLPIDAGTWAELLELAERFDLPTHTYPSS